MNLENEELIKKWEKLKLVAYLPTPDDVWTIGWGHTLGVKKGDVITVAQAQAFFEQDVSHAVSVVNKVKVPLSQHQFDALVSLVFNIGGGNFSTSTLLKRLNAKDYEGAANQFLVWDKQRTKTGMTRLRGLTIRRQEERDYFLQADVEDGPASASVAAPDSPKSLLSSKEVLAGAGAALTGAGSFLGGLDSHAQQILSVGLSLALLGFGAFFIWNRWQARVKGQR